MRAVAVRARITAGAIYKHFPSRRALVERVVFDSLTRFEEVLLRNIAGRPVGSFERLAALGAAYIRFAEEHRAHFQVLFAPRPEGPRRLEELPGAWGYDVLRRCVAEAIANGAVRPADPDLVALFLWTRVHGIVLFLAACDPSGVARSHSSRLTPERLFKMTRSFVLDGLAPRNQGAKRRTSPGARRQLARRRGA